MKRRGAKSDRRLSVAARIMRVIPEESRPDFFVGTAANELPNFFHKIQEINIKKLLLESIFFRVTSDAISLQSKLKPLSFRFRKGVWLHKGRMARTEKRQTVYGKRLLRSTLNLEN